MFKRITKAVRYNILVGLVLVTPVGLTLLIANWLFLLITNVFLPKAFEDSTHQLLIRFVVLGIVIAMLFLIGFFVRSYFGKALYRLGDKLLARLPLISRIYIQVRHISEVIVARRQTLFQEVVLVEYPRRGLYSIGFITAPAPPSFGNIINKNEDSEVVSIFVPTTPNPTSGIFIMSPRSDLTTLSIDVTDAMKFIVSAGAVHPGEEPSDDRPALIDKLEAWLSAEGRHDPS